jgi:protein-S-isoprenylcysteine O-methyltransferase Ste14
VRWVAALVLFLQLPVPLFWFVLHPQIGYWRTRQKTAYAVGLLGWPVVGAGLAVFRHDLFLREYPATWRMAVGFALLVFEVGLFERARRDLGTARFIGRTELSGGGEVVSQGIYGRMRNPRYVGSFLAIMGACLLAGTGRLWLVAAAWTILIRLVIGFEEREMRNRFGDAYVEYCRRVPRFFSLRRTPPRSP